MFIFSASLYILRAPPSLSWTDYVYLRRELPCFQSTLGVPSLCFHTPDRRFAFDFRNFRTSLTIDLKLDFCMVRRTRPSRLSSGPFRPIGSVSQNLDTDLFPVVDARGKNQSLSEPSSRPLTFWRALARDQSRRPETDISRYVVANSHTARNVDVGGTLPPPAQDHMALSARPHGMRLVALSR